MIKDPEKSPFEFVPEPIRALFAKRPLVAGESPDEYDAMVMAVAEAVGPIDGIEAIYVKDFVDTTWEIQRCRRYQARIIDNELSEAFARLLQRAEQFDGDALKKKARRLAQAYCAGEPDAVAAVPKLLAGVGLTIESAEALAFHRHIDDLGRIANMIGIAETRRRHIIREIEFHREVLGWKLRKMAESDPTNTLQLPELEDTLPDAQPN
jgi:hypothetical protein